MLQAKAQLKAFIQNRLIFKGFLKRENRRTNKKFAKGALVNIRVYKFCKTIVNIKA